MNREEAKILLSTSRSDGSDANDPQVAEALALVARDAELRAWFEAEQAVDKVIAAKLKAVPLPADLLERVRGETQARIADKPPRPSFAVAMAAGIALLGFLAVLWFNRMHPSPTDSFAAYRADMAKFLREFPRLDITTDRLPEVREWLTRQHPLLRVQLPNGLERFPSIGCRTVEWQGRKLALVCFMAEGNAVHLFVMPRVAFPDAPLTSTPVMAKIGGQNTAGWSNGENLYLVVTRAEESLLRKLL